MKRKLLSILMCFAFGILGHNLPVFGSLEISSDFRQLDQKQLVSEMGTGWNLGNSLEASNNGKASETAWNNPTVTKEIIEKVKSAGFNNIRIPVSYLDKIGAAPDYTVDAMWLSRIQEVVDYAISQDMYVMINMHGDGYKTVVGSWLIVDAKDQEAIQEKYKKVWQQVANKFINYDEHLIFESMNEEFDGDWDDPLASDYANLNIYNQIFVDTIRQTGGNNSARWLLIPGWNTNIDYTIGNYGFEIPTDKYRSASIPDSEKRIAISVHYYTPWDFCGAEGPITQWGATATEPDSTLGWGQEDYMESQFNGMYKKFVSKGYPFIVGEYGSIDKTITDPKNKTYRQIFAKTLCSTVKRYGGVPVYWDNGYNGSSGFGLFDRNTCTITQKDIIDAIMDAKKSTPEFDPKVTPIVITPTPIPDGSFVVTYDSSDSGTVNLAIKNNLKMNTDKWALEFTFPGDQKITSIWGGKLTQDGPYVKITNADYNGKITANGGVATLGFNVSFSGENKKPTSFTINQSKCLVDGDVNTPTKAPTKVPSEVPTKVTTTVTKVLQYGDANNDKVVDSGDYQILRSVLLGKIGVPDSEFKLRMDLNTDGGIDSGDYSILRMFLLEKIKTLPYVLK